MFACSDHCLPLPWSSGLCGGSTFPGGERAIWMPHVGHTAVLSGFVLAGRQQGCLPWPLLLRGVWDSGTGSARMVGGGMQGAGWGQVWRWLYPVGDWRRNHLPCFCVLRRSLPFPCHEAWAWGQSPQLCSQAGGEQGGR